MSVDEIRDLEQLLDPHNLGSFTESKLVNALTNLMTSYDDQKTLEALEILDTDNDGKISVEEFEYFMNEYGDKLQHYEQKILGDLVNPLSFENQVKIETLAFKIKQFK